MEKKLGNICRDRSLCQGANQVFFLNISYTYYLLGIYLSLLHVLKILINVFCISYKKSLQKYSVDFIQFITVAFH